jgi:hypothetical protein
VSRRLTDIEFVDELIEEASNGLHDPQAIVYTAQNAEAAFESIKAALKQCAVIINECAKSPDAKAEAYDNMAEALEGVLPEIG